MPAATVVSAIAAIMGPPNKDGSFWARSTFTISDGTTQSLDRPNVPAGTDYAGADLTAQTAALNAQLAIVPSPVQLYQAHQAIINAGLYAQINAVVAQASADVQSLWFASQTIDRNDPNLIALGTAIGLSSDQIDDLFRAAARL